MNAIAANVWLIPALPLAAAAVIAVLPRRAARGAMALAIVAMVAALVLSMVVFGTTLAAGASGGTRVLNFDWFRLGTGVVRLGFLMDPLGAVMLVMVSLVGLLIFVFSVGYMAHDDNITRFFGFLSLFAAAMLGLVVANSLLLLFVCWEIMGVASYLLIGFWFLKPSAAAAAKKAFIVTRIGDLGLFLGMLWLVHATGTLLFYDAGRGALEADALVRLGAGGVGGAVAVATAISLLIFVGAIGKSGQVPLHVWLPDAMEGPTPVSALIHAATMVAAGVFLIARVFPLMALGSGPAETGGPSPALTVVAIVGAVTALFGALLAVGQSDIKRILAYSTISQLGYMFLGLATGGVAVGMFHLLTHAFFKALLFLGAGSLIHGCHEEQDIRHMGGLRRWMPVTFATYAVGMMALAGVPLVFSGFWSKDEILHAAWLWNPSRIPFVMGLLGAFLTAFYMTRQVAEVFFGTYRGGASDPATRGAHPAHVAKATVQESSGVMTGPLVVLAAFAILLGFLGTPAWPWLQSYLEGRVVRFVPEALGHALPLMLVSTVVVGAGLVTGWWLYGRHPRTRVEEPDTLESFFPRVFAAMRNRFGVDALYDATVVRTHAILSSLSAWLDTLVIGAVVTLTALVVQSLAHLARWIDELLVNPGFDAGCSGMRRGGWGLSRLQGGRAQGYLAGMALGMVVLTVLLVWGMQAG